MSKIQPVIKWSGSKRLLAEEIISYFPKEINTYYEPFLGGGSILLTLKPHKAVCIDINESLIDFWNKLKNQPEFLAAYYEKTWNDLQNDYLTFNRIRDKYNESFQGEDLLFLSRTCVNGLIRYNQSGEFNNSLHYSRKGINPKTLSKNLLDTSIYLKDYTFKYGDYYQILETVSSGDFVYMDPPYYNTKSMYYGKIDYERFWNFMRELNKKGVKYAFSFDGTSDKRDYLIEVPDDVYSRHILLRGGQSTFNKIIDKTENNVFESLYLNW